MTDIQSLTIDDWEYIRDVLYHQLTVHEELPWYRKIISRIIEKVEYQLRELESLEARKY